MNDFVKAMLIKELLEEGTIIGYRFKKRLKKQGITVSNGSIYLHLKNLYEQNFVTKEKDGRTVIYQLTKSGKKALSSNIDSVPSAVQKKMMKIAGLIPHTNWNDATDVKQFYETLSDASKQVKERLEELL